MIPCRIGFIGALAGLFFLSVSGFARAQSSRRDPNAALIAAAEKGDLASAQLLLKEGANVNAAGPDGWTPLMLAVGRRNVKMVKLLLENGANADLKDSNDETALEEAIRADSAPVVDLLLKRGIDQKTLDESLLEAAHGLPAMIVMSGGKTGAPQPIAPDPVVTLLIEKGADTNSRDEDGSTPLDVAAAFGQTASAKALLAGNADIEARDNFGNTPLLSAACDCAIATMPDTYDTVKLLLENGADINARNDEGDTALIIGSGGGVVKTDIVKLLIEKGADLRLKNAQGETALMIAEKDQVTDVIRLLKAALAK